MAKRESIMQISRAQIKLAQRKDKKQVDKHRRNAQYE